VLWRSYGIWRKTHASGEYEAELQM